MNNELDKRGKNGAALIAVCAGAAALAVYVIYNLAIGKFTFDVFLLILAGLVFALASLFTNFRFAPVFSVVGYGLAISFYLNNRIIMFEEMINHITGMTERNNIFAVVIAIFVLLLIAAIAAVAASFKEKEAA